MHHSKDWTPKVVMEYAFVARSKVVFLRSIRMIDPCACNRAHDT